MGLEEKTRTWGGWSWSLLTGSRKQPGPGLLLPDSHQAPVQGVSSVQGHWSPALTAPGSDRGPAGISPRHFLLDSTSVRAQGSPSNLLETPLDALCPPLSIIQPQQLICPSPLPGLSPGLGGLRVQTHSCGAGCLPGASTSQGSSCSCPSPTCLVCIQRPVKLTRAGRQKWEHQGQEEALGREGQQWGLTQSLRNGWALPKCTLRLGCPSPHLPMVRAQQHLLLSRGAF